MNTNLKLASSLSRIAGFLVLMVTLISIFSGEFYYVFMDDARVATYQGQDLIALLSLPLFFLAIHYAKRKKFIALNIWLGLLGFYLYIYSTYAFNGIYSELFLFYLAIISLSFYAIIRLLNAVDAKVTNKFFSRNVPVKMTSIYFILIALLQAIGWITIILQHIKYDEPAPANAIYVLDLAFLLPLFVLTAYWLWRKHAKGFLSAPVLLVFSSIYGLAFLAGQVFKYYRALEYQPIATYIFIVFTFIAIILSVTFLISRKNSVRDTA